MMEPREFIEFSGKIIAYDKAGARSSVSRSYYGAFHEALALLADLECSPPRNGNSHNLAPKFLRCSEHSDAKKAGNLLADLHSDRIKADYRLEKTNWENIEFAKVCIGTVNVIMDSLGSFKLACEDDDVKSKFQNSVNKLKSLHGM